MSWHLIYNNAIVVSQEERPTSYQRPATGVWVSVGDDTPDSFLVADGWQSVTPPTPAWYQDLDLPVYQGGSVQYSLSDKPLAEVQQLKLDMLATDLQTALATGVIQDGYTWKTTEDERLRLAEVVALVSTWVPFPANWTWRDASNTDVSRDASQMVAIGQAVVLHVDSKYDSYDTLVDSVNGASDVASVVALGTVT